MKEETKCCCGEHKKCIRKINTSSNGKMWIENKSHFNCGKIKNQIKKLNELFKQDEIMEKFIKNGKQSKNIYTEEDMKLFADWCRNGLLNTEYSVDRLDKHLEQWKQFKNK